MEIKQMNIFQKMSNITNEIDNVAKNLKIEFGKTKYSAVGEGDVLRAVKPIEFKYGVYSLPISREVVDSGIMEQKSGSKSLYLRIKTVYRFYNTDNPSEYVDTETLSDGVDSQDKAPGKGMTYGDKYALLKAYKIETGDDPDKDASKPLKDLNKQLSNKERIKNMIKGTNFKGEDVAVLIKAITGEQKQANDLTPQEMEQVINQIAKEVL